jgi:hypothetical protein
MFQLCIKFLYLTGTTGDLDFVSLLQSTLRVFIFNFANISAQKIIFFTFTLNTEAAGHPKHW